MSKIVDLNPINAECLVRALEAEGHAAFWYNTRRGVVVLTDAPQATVRSFTLSF